ncbi:MAG: BatD family protein [Magnetococcus sp. YQC-5]
MVKSLTMTLILWAVLMLVFPLAGEAGDIQVRVSRNPVALSESFSLRFEAADNPDGEPDFTPLEKDFEILDRSQSTNFQFINGQKSQSITWTLELMPKRAGALVIPPIAFGKDRSTLMTITVQQGRSTNPDDQAADSNQNGVLLEAEVSTHTPFVQEQTILTIRFLQAVQIASASMNDPVVGSGDAMMEKIGEDQTYETQRNGRHYRVTERHYILFPQRSGKLVINGVSLTVQLPGQGGGRLLKELLSDPLFNNIPFGFGRPGRTLRLNTQAIELDVQPTPSEWAGQPWLPMHRLILSDKWSPDPPHFQVGEPVTRTITLLADGLAAAQLPAISGSLPESIKHYPDRPLLEDQKEPTGIIGKRTEKIAMIPSTPGTYSLPAIAIPWWNTDTRKMEIARLPEKSITVLPAPGTPTVQTPIPKQQETQSPALTPPVPTQNPAPSTAAMTPVASAGIWPWISLFLTGGWMMTVLLWWQTRRRTASRMIKTKQSDTTPHLKESAARLRAACLANDPVAARAVLNEYPFEETETLKAAIQDLNAALFGRTTTSWQGNELWSAVQNILNQSRPKNHTNQEILPPLYPV